MPELTTLLQSLLNREEAVTLLKTAVACESITGNEAGFASFIADELNSLGASHVTLRDFEPGRPNVWGVLEGPGKGRRLLVTGHTDTVHVEGWQERWIGTEREDPFGGAVIEGALWGRGAGDLKAGICATLAATRLLERAGIELAGDLVFAFVGDEESGQSGSGTSAGMKSLVKVIQTGELPKADFAIYVEPTQLAVYVAQMGFLIADIHLTGKSAYFGVPELGKDALKAAHRVFGALLQYSDDLGTRGSHPLIGQAFLLVTEMKGGGYIAVPGESHLSLIRKLLPGEDIEAAVKELETIIHSAVADEEIGVSIRYPAARDDDAGGTAVEVDPDLPAVSMLSAAVNRVVPGYGEIQGAPYWSEAPFLVNTLGIPTVYFAPGDIRNCHTLEERVVLQDYFAGIVALAAFMAEYCGVVVQPHQQR